MANCTYHLINDLYTAMDDDLKDIAEKIDALEFTVDINELDIDLDNLERQLAIRNKLEFLNAVGTDIMTEEEQLAVYTDLKNEIFAPSATTEPMQNEEGD